MDPPPEPGSARRSLVRTCVGCRKACDREELVRLVADAAAGGRVGPAGRHFRGRGAWLHPRLECAAAAVRTRAFGRAFRRAVTVPSAEELLAALVASRAP